MDKQRIVGIGPIWLILIFACTAWILPAIPNPSLVAQDEPKALSAEELALVRAVESRRIDLIEDVIGSVIAIYGPSRQGGGSGVIIDESGLALTNHHVIQGAGLNGLGGLSDGQLYPWELIGTDPGGDVALIQMKGRPKFPYTPLGDSDQVQIGDWALAMGNPFLLAHDQTPTVTLGIVSGIERFQQGAGSNQLVYGNCIQIDSSINPGNSGGPLFNLQGEVIGINGRGSFRDRGRVNVGLGYAISANQIKNFIPDLMATKIVEHGTLDAAFTDRGGKVICSTIDLDSRVAQLGLELGDELIEFEGQAITYANQFKNLICTLPEDWPAHLVIRKPDGREQHLHVRLFGLPYNFQARIRPDDDEPQPKREPDDEPEEDRDRQKDQPDSPPRVQAESKDLKEYLLKETGVVINREVNRRYLKKVIDAWQSFGHSAEGDTPSAWVIEDEIREEEAVIGVQSIHLAADGRFRVQFQIRDDAPQTYVYDGEQFWELSGEPKPIDRVAAKINPQITQAMALGAALQPKPFHSFGTPSLDGSDKAQGILSSRVLWLDEDEDWFYGWLSRYDELGNPEVRLLKISSDKDCEGKSGGVTFADYRATSGFMLPWRKQLVRGLGEQVQWTAVTQSIQPVTELDESKFQFDDGGRP